MEEKVERLRKDEQGRAVKQKPKKVVVVKHRRISRNLSWLAGVAAVILMAIIFLFVRKGAERLEEKNKNLDKQIATLESQLSEQETRREELEKKSIYITTKQFIEEFAREKLGLVFEDEIIFRPKEE